MASRTSRYNVVAAYPDMDGARKAIDALQFAGVDSADIALLGSGARKAQNRADRSIDTTERDRPMVGHIVLRAVVFGAIGAGVGAALGFVLALIGFEFGPAVDSLPVQLATWAMFGVIVGTLWGAYSALSVNPGWELTFQPTDTARVLVGVNRRTDAEIERAEKLLRDKGAISVEEFSEAGRRRAG